MFCILEGRGDGVSGGEFELSVHGKWKRERGVKEGMDRLSIVSDDS